ncbi:glutathione S-transferase [Caulobacter ginsengisoli]|uniref:glutathione transferase n=1 Tax=Caulobacter ginsengisoli TaxID=400775 RepID=A0ABU0IKL6_9CAUL|nr:glutathione S-transferase family protein [Caulobacter ginsengisoli]MDQ0462549.1 glutathione S-transferase [Caulobacter ginsengisoli]
MTDQPVLYGAAYSVYVRAVRLALAEKEVAYRLEEVDVFARGGPPPEHLARHPFGRIPAFEHGAVRLYEAAAIERYVDEAFPGPALQPTDPAGRARMVQVIGIMDSYFYRTQVWDIYVERISNPAHGRPTDEARIAAALPKAATCLRALAERLGEDPWLAGPTLSLADLHAAPMFDLVMRTPEAAGLMAPLPSLQAWWARIKARPSMRQTLSAD